MAIVYRNAISTAQAGAKDKMMHLFYVVLATVLTGVICAIITWRVARRSLWWAAILSPLSVMLAMAVGLLVGIKLMLIEAGMAALSIVAAVVPVALFIGIFVSMISKNIIAQTHAQLAREKRQREVEQARRDLITWLSHDLRTPLAGIRAMGEALEDNVASDPQQYYRNIIELADRTSAMVSDLMEMASLRSKTTQIHSEVIAVSDLVSDLIAQLTPLANSRQVQLKGSIETNCSDVYGDAGLLTRALQNLIVNAIQYTRADTTVDATICSSDENVCVVVSDHCGGLSPADQERMFDAGWRGDAARTPGAVSGSGLGLPIVRTIIEAHGGTVQVANHSDGCVMRLVIPVAQPC